MYTIIISAVVMAIFATVLVKMLKSSPKWFYIVYCVVVGVLIGVLIADKVPAEYEPIRISKYTLNNSESISIKGRNISFFYEDNNGTIIPMEIVSDSVEINYDCDKAYVEETEYHNTNLFSWPIKNKTTGIRIFIPNQ